MAQNYLGNIDPKNYQPGAESNNIFSSGMRSVQGIGNRIEQGINQGSGYDPQARARAQAAQQAQSAAQNQRAQTAGNNLNFINQGRQDPSQYQHLNMYKANPRNPGYRPDMQDVLSSGMSGGSGLTAEDVTNWYYNQYPDMRPEPAQVQPSSPQALGTPRSQVYAGY